MCRDFIFFYDPLYGPCYTFNGDPIRARIVSFAGRVYGLSLLLETDPATYLPIIDSIGVRVALHTPGEYFG